jgi:transcriptional regulator with XRE-family HTH domain
MAIVETNSASDAKPNPAGRRRPRAAEPLHRVAQVRKEQGVSLRTAARQLGSDVQELKQQEAENTDLRLTDLYAWQRVLDVPVADLLVEPDSPLSRPVMERAQLLRLMKTAAAMLERSNSAAIRRLAQTMVDQLVEIMPELKDVSPWHAVGQRRSLEEIGRIAEQPLAEEVLFGRRYRQ